MKLPKNEQEVQAAARAWLVIKEFPSIMRVIFEEISRLLELPAEEEARGHPPFPPQKERDELEAVRKELQDAQR